MLSHSYLLRKHPDQKGKGMVFPEKEDITSGFFVFLIALPLCMGIALASGFPPVSGIITAIVGGCVSSFLGSSALTIKGPAAGLIVIAISAVQELGMGDPVLGYKRCLAVGVLAALVQIVFATMKMGSFAELMPPSVVHGMLAAIGLIIISKQAHVLLGVTPSGLSPVELLAEIPRSFERLNPEVFLIGGISLCILVLYPLIKHSAMRKIPAPLIAIFLSIPASFYFDFDHSHQYQLFGGTYRVGPNFLVDLPGNIVKSISFPDFSYIFSITSFKYVIMFALVGMVESLLTVSAVDSLDPKKKHSDLNKDLLSVGIGNIVASLIGGLPMISEIVRSKANIDNGARSHWSNVSHGIFLLISVAFFPHLLHYIPLAVLSAMLVYTGYRLSSPGEFIHTYKMGKDQFFLFSSTFVITLFSDLLIGVSCGLILKIILHKIRGASLRNPFRIPVNIINREDKNIIEVKGASIFTGYLSLKKEVENLKTQKKPIEINFNRSPVIDMTVQTKLRALQRELGTDKLKIVGFEKHRALSEYAESTKVL